MKIALLPLCLFLGLQTHAQDLRSYFTRGEIQAALGENPDLEPGALQPNSGDPYAEEDESDEEILEFEKDNARGDQGAPIWSSFIANFRSCAQGCLPANYSTYGSRGKASCHNSGRAIDVGAIICGGHTHKAIHGGRFAQFVACMRSKMKTIYRNGRHVTLGHHDHAHFSNGCTVAGGRSYY